MMSGDLGCLPDEILKELLAGVFHAGFVCKLFYELTGPHDPYDRDMNEIYTHAIRSGNTRLVEFLQGVVGNAPDGALPKHVMGIALSTSVDMSKYIRGLGFVVQTEYICCIFENADLHTVKEVFKWVSDNYSYMIDLDDTAVLCAAAKGGDLSKFQYTYFLGFKPSCVLGTVLAPHPGMFVWLCAVLHDHWLKAGITREYAIVIGDLPMLQGVSSRLTNIQMTTVVVEGHLHILQNYTRNMTAGAADASRWLFTALEHNHTHIAEYLADNGVRITPFYIQSLSRKGNLPALQWLHDKSLFDYTQYTSADPATIDWLESIGCAEPASMLVSALRSGNSARADKLMTEHPGVFQDGFIAAWHDAIKAGTYRVLLKHGFVPPTHLLIENAYPTRVLVEMLEYVDNDRLAAAIRSYMHSETIYAKILFDRGLLSTEDIRSRLRFMGISQYIYWSKFIPIEFNESQFMVELESEDIQLAIYIYENSALDHAKCMVGDRGVCRVLLNSHISGIKWAHTVGFRLDEETVSHAITCKRTDVVRFAAGVDYSLGKWTIYAADCIRATDTTSGKTHIFGI